MAAPPARQVGARIELRDQAWADGWHGKRFGMLTRFRKLVLDESGPELVEWAVVTVVLLLATGVILSQIYDRVIEVMVGILVQLTQ